MYYGGLMGYYFDPTWILVIIGAVLSMAASAKVNSTFNKYSKVRSMTGMTGEDAAKRLLNSQGIYDVTVRPVKGQLTDHYDPRTKTVNLSESVFHSTSVAAIGVAAHESGHAMQDNVGYVPLKLRGAIVPVANIGSQAAFPLIIIGVLIGGMGSPLVNIGLILFSLAVIFQLIQDVISSKIHIIGRNNKGTGGDTLNLSAVGISDAAQKIYNSSGDILVGIFQI